MIRVRKSGERGHAHHGWLDTYHTFSFSDYFDPSFSGFSDLRVINEDRVEAGEGFGMHGHEDMEIVSYVLEGSMEHRDSMGNGFILRPGDIQRMSAGTGVRHSEFNPSRSDRLHLLQIWIIPSEAGIPPGYEEKSFSTEERKNQLRRIVSPDGKEGSLKIHQDAVLYTSLLDPGNTVNLSLDSGRRGWVQIGRGSVELNGTLLGQGDGAAIEGETALTLKAVENSEFLIFDLR